MCVYASFISFHITLKLSLEGKAKPPKISYILYLISLSLFLVKTKEHPLWP